MHASSSIRVAIDVKVISGFRRRSLQLSLFVCLSSAAYTNVD